MGGIERSGWRLVFNATKPKYLAMREMANRTVDERYGPGLILRANEATRVTDEIDDVVRGSPADRSGLAAGMKLIAVDGRTFSAERFHAAVAAAATRREPIQLIAQSHSYVTTRALDYHGGERYPHLERVTAKADRLTQSIRPRSRSISGGPSGRSPAATEGF